MICGCFKGTLEEFLSRVQETHGNSKHAQVYQKAAKLAKLQILGEEKFNKNFFGKYIKTIAKINVIK